MPSILGAAKVLNLMSGAKLKVGDSIQLKPVSTAKQYAGSGSFNSGDIPRANNLVSCTNTIDADVKDQTQDNFGIEDSVFPFLFL